MPLRLIPQRDRKLHRLVKKGETLDLRRNQVLFRPGDPAGELYLVRSGHLRLSQSAAGGPGRTVAIIGPWEMGGEKGLLPGTPRDFLASAGEESQITLLEGPAVRKALQTSERTFEAFLWAKEEEIALARALTGHRRPGGAAARLGLLVTHLAKRLGRPGEVGTRIPIRLTHQLLADLTASHRSTVTTLLNDWIYQGILRDEEGCLEILDPEGLRAGGQKGPIPSSVDRKTP